MTPTKTPFAGLERLSASDPLSSDGFIFQDEDRAVIDHLLQLGVLLHKHDAHAAMANPTVAPTLAAPATGGSIPSGQLIYVTYTLIDADGGETLKVTPVSITTPAGYVTPTQAPAETVSYLAGTLLAGNYSYAITATDGLGGETALGPPILATVNPGFPTAEVILSGIQAAMHTAFSTAAGWRLWRQRGGGPWYLIGTGTTADTFTDNGVAGDCTISPPPTGTTKGANQLSVTVPAGGQPSGVVNFNLYVSLDGTFTSPSLLATLPAASLGVAQVFNSLAPTSGSPPPVSRSFGGANKIDAMTQLLNLLRAAGTLPTNVQAGDYTFAQTDVGLVVESNSATGRTFTIPPFSSVPFDYPGLAGANGGATIEVFQYGVGQVTFAAGAGVTIRSDGARQHTAGQYATVGLRQRALNEWVLSGDLA